MATQEQINALAQQFAQSQNSPRQPKEPTTAGGVLQRIGLGGRGVTPAIVGKVVGASITETAPPEERAATIFGQQQQAIGQQLPSDEEVFEKHQINPEDRKFFFLDPVRQTIAALPSIVDKKPVLTQEGEVVFKKREIREKKIAEFDIKKEQLRKDLESFKEIDNLIDRATGGLVATRFAGVKSQFRALSQEGVKGVAARTHDAFSKRLRVQLVRAAGDVGNINIVEQEAAEQLIPGFFDSQPSADIKSAFLDEITEAIGEDNGNAVRDALAKYMETDVYTPPDFPDAETAEKAGLPDGSIITINGQRAVFEIEEKK